MAVPYTFGSATTSIPLSQLDSNFATTITLGNTAIQLGNTVTTLNNMTLASPTLTTPALGTPASGVMTNVTGIPAAQITGSQAIPKSTLPTGSVLQVVSTSKTDTFTTLSSSFVIVTGLTATITPSSASSKILVFAMLAGGSNENVNAGGAFRLYRDGSLVTGAVGDAAGNRTTAFAQSASGYANPWKLDTKTLVFLHSPSTSSSTTYQIYARAEDTSGGTTVNYAYNDNNVSDRVRLLSTITLMEIAA